MDILTVAMLAGCGGFFAAAGLAIIPLSRLERTLRDARTTMDQMAAERDFIRAHFNDFRSRAYVRNAKGQIERWTDLHG